MNFNSINFSDGNSLLWLAMFLLGAGLLVWIIFCIIKKYSKTQKQEIDELEKQVEKSLKDNQEISV